MQTCDDLLEDAKYPWTCRRRKLFVEVQRRSPHCLFHYEYASNWYPLSYFASQEQFERWEAYAFAELKARLRKYSRARQYCPTCEWWRVHELSVGPDGRIVRNEH